MPTLDPRFVILPPLQQVIFDKRDGTLLADGVVTFYKDNDRTILKPIYKLTLNPSNEYEYIQLNNPLILSSIGSFVDNDGNNYVPLLFPYDGTPDSTDNTPELYYINVEASDGYEQFTVEHWPQQTVDGASSINGGSENQLANPQFVGVLFTPDLTTDIHTYTVSGTNTVTPVAPGWDFVTIGTGTIDVKWVEVVDTTAPSNPPYALEIQGGGSLTSLILRQSLTNSPRLFANGFVAASFVVNSQDGIDHNLTLNYVPQLTGDSYEIINGQSGTAITFVALSGSVAIDGSINSSPASTGYVNIELTIPPLAHIQVSSFQLVAASSIDVSDTFIQQSSQRQLDHLFHYYKPQLDFKPIRSFLVGWDFTTNPSQWGATQTVNGTTAYLWDQTIAACGPSSYTVVRNSTTGGLQLTAVGNNSAFYIMQYLTLPEVNNLVQGPMSVNLNAWVGAAGTADPITAQIHLYRAPASSSIPTLPTSIGTLSVLGDFTLTASGWTEIPRQDQGLAKSSLSGLPAGISSIQTADIGFSGWQLTDNTQIGDTSYFAIVVTVATNATNDSVIIDSVSLVPGLIPTRPAPQTPGEVLRECQYYYEQSYQPGTAPGTAATNASRIEKLQNIVVGGGNISSAPGPFQIDFKTFKITPPAMTFYSPATGTSGNVTVALYNNGAFVASNTGVSFATNWQLDVNVGLYNAAYVQLTANLFNTTAASSVATNGLLFFHYTADSRLGI